MLAEASLLLSEGQEAEGTGGGPSQGVCRWPTIRALPPQESGLCLLPSLACNEGGDPLRREGLGP